MTPTSSRPLGKVWRASVATAVAAIVLALVKHYVWADMPADLAGPLNTIILALVLAGASGITGYLTPIAPGEIAPQLPGDADAWKESQRITKPMEKPPS